MTITDDQGNKYELVADVVGQYVLNPINKAPKRWRAESDGRYFTLNYGKVDNTYESGGDLDQSCYDSGLYFQTETEAQAALDKIKKLLTGEGCCEGD